MTEFWEKSGKMHLVLVLAVAVLVSCNSLFNGFVWDDRIYLLGNKALREFDIGKILFTRVTGIEYFPVRDLSLALDYRIWGENAFGFHLVGLLLYSLNCIAVYLLCRELGRLASPPQRGSEAAHGIAPLLAALLFAVHPVHAEVFNWITCRGALLSGLFSFLACYAFLRFLETPVKRVRFLSLAVACYACALLSKAYCLTVPLVLAIFIYLHHDRKSLKSWCALLPFFALALVAFLGFSQIGTSSNLIIDSAAKASGFAGKAALAFQIPFFYLAKLALPLNLSAEYQTVFATSLTDMRTIAAGSGFIVLLASLIVALRYRSVVFSLAAGWFLVTLLPVLNFFATHPVVADRYAFLPSFAFCFLAGHLFAGGAARSRGGIIVCGLLLLLWGGMTFNQNRVWLSDKTLWEQAIRVKPTAYAYVNLGDYHFWRGEYEQAFANFDKAREISPGNTKKFLYQGYLQYQRKDYPEAIRLFSELLARDDSIMARYFLGMAHVANGDKAAAAEAFRQVLVSKDMDPQGHYRRSAKENLKRLGADENAQ